MRMKKAPPLRCLYIKTAREESLLMTAKRSAAMLCALLLMLCAFMPAAAGEEKQYLDVLLIGVDNRGEEEAGRSDTMMLMRINRESGAVRLVSFLRDLYVEVPGYGQTRLNAAYFYGGEALLKETLQKNFGVTADRTASVHFSTLSELVDEIGGVEIEVTEKELPWLNSLLEDFGMPPVEKAGLQRLSGVQALCYSRIRKPDSDFQRTSRQQAVIAAMLEELKGRSKWQLLRMALRHLERIETDLTFGDMVSLVPLMAKLDEIDIQSAHVPAGDAFAEKTINGMMVLVPDLKRCRSALQDFLN